MLFWCPGCWVFLPTVRVWDFEVVAMGATRVEEAVLDCLREQSCIDHSGRWATGHGFDHSIVNDVVKSLHGSGYVEAEVVLIPSQLMITQFGLGLGFRRRICFGWDFWNCLFGFAVHEESELGGHCWGHDLHNWGLSWGSGLCVCSCRGYFTDSFGGMSLMSYIPVMQLAYVCYEILLILEYCYRVSWMHWSMTWGTRERWRTNGFSVPRD